MGKRIRWIWVISLAAALAAIGVQGYWLFNQFRYEMCTYADEIAGEVFHAGQEEFRIRKEEAEMTKGLYRSPQLMDHRMYESLTQLVQAHLLPDRTDLETQTSQQ